MRERRKDKAAEEARILASLGIQQSKEEAGVFPLPLAISTDASVTMRDSCFNEQGLETELTSGKAPRRFQIGKKTMQHIGGEIRPTHP